MLPREGANPRGGQDNFCRGISCFLTWPGGLRQSSPESQTACKFRPGALGSTSFTGLQPVPSHGGGGGVVAGTPTFVYCSAVTVSTALIIFEQGSSMISLHCAPQTT